MEYHDCYNDEHIINVNKGDKSYNLRIPLAAYYDNRAKAASVISFAVFVLSIVVMIVFFTPKSAPKPVTNPDGSAIPVLIKQNAGEYIKVLETIPTCKLVTQDENVILYSCPNGTKITQTKWTRRGGELKGTVTRQYDKYNNEMSRYGHPDDL